ncbi:hypothetical protein [Halorubrum ezzemoulense]|uniref:hypothetical protein n=1 Tax=Halorubrum ezzemoulense TaxID=337243 RepID=UPI00232A8900|nr:hypothetical protein [Halorubrum ezzemoulense]MDB2242504.1 hypothetical protein [Halorubrum ezzemoulense]
MNIPVSEDLATSRGLIEVWIEETMDLDFDLSGEGQYVDTGAIEGEIQVDFEVNRSELIDRLDRAEDPSIKDQINMFLEDWSADSMDTEEVYLDYGRLLLRGAEPTELDAGVELGEKFDPSELRTTSPDELKRKLRKERKYETTYDALADDVSEYLEREGITGTPSFNAPVHVQASALPMKGGTDFIITVENNEPTAIQQSITVEVEMPPEVGREVTLGHDGEHDHLDKWQGDAISGNYDPEKEAFLFHVTSLSAVGDPGSEREIRFNVPARAKGTLDYISGIARFVRDKPFSNIIPETVFDAGGHRLGGDLGKVNAKGRVEATFETPTEAVTIGGTSYVQKRFQVEGLTPTDAFGEIENIVRDRGIDGAAFDAPDSTHDIREGKTKFEGAIRGGSVLVGDTRVAVDIQINGEVRSSDKQTSRENDENLPAERRSVTVEYGNTGVDIKGRGADQSVVDDYITDLRDELQVSLQSMSEAM